MESAFVKECHELVHGMISSLQNKRGYTRILELSHLHIYMSERTENISPDHFGRFRNVS